MLWIEFISYLKEIGSCKGSASLAKKHQLFKELITKSNGKALVFFNRDFKTKLNVNSSSINKCLTLDSTKRTLDLDLDQVIERHQRIYLLHGQGSQNAKIQILAQVFSGLSQQDIKVLRDYYDKDMFKIGLAQKTVFNCLVELHPHYENLLRQSLQTGLNPQQMYECCRTGVFNSGPTLKPMLASTSKIEDKEYFAQLKLDGIRVMLKRFNGVYSSWTRSGMKLDSEVLLSLIPKSHQTRIKKVKGDFLLDGQLWTPHLTSGEGFRLLLPIVKSKKQRASKLEINAYYHPFDILHYKMDLLNKPYVDRRAILQKLNIPIVKRRIIKDVKILPKLVSHLKNTPYEGLILKEPNSIYQPGKRSSTWIKLKPKPQTFDVLVVNAQRGTGKYEKYYASFDIAVQKDGQYLPVGQVGSGFTEQDLKQLSQLYDQEEKIIIEVEAEAFNSTGGLRFPRYVRLRPDKDQPNNYDQLKKFMN